MKKALAVLAKKYWFHKGVVLMYHRVTTMPQDIWGLAVSPQHFEQHLQVLKKETHVVSVPELMEQLLRKKLPRHTVAITFDDGYADNYLNALPLLERYQLPATFFIASGNIGAGKEFSWDDLENLILNTPQLPSHFSLIINNELVEYNLEDETNLSEHVATQHRNWDACNEQPPTRRSFLFFQVWEKLRALPAADQQTTLQQIRTWIGTPAPARPENYSMTKEQLQTLAKHPLVTIGAHTVTHPALAAHAATYQEQELAENKSYLESITGKTISALAYPYGNYRDDTIAAAGSAGLKAAFTTDPKLIYTRWHHPFRLGRFEVNNWNGTTFKQKLGHWFRQNS